MSKLTKHRVLTTSFFAVTLIAVSIFASLAFAQRRAVPKSESEKPVTRSKSSREKREEAERLRNARKSQNISQGSEITEITRVSVAPIKPKIFHGDLRRLPFVKEKVKGERPEPQEPEVASKLTGEPDAALQTFLPAAPAPTPSASFPGLDFANWGAGWPPDTNGDVGPNHFIQTVNTSIGIYDKATGTRLAAFTFDQFFSQSPTGTPCDNANQGDPVVLYDALSDRWIITDFAWSNYTSGAMYQCMAVSQTGDPVSGGWYFYPWQTAAGGKIPDYPKLGVWPDGIYMSANVFNTTGAGSFQNVQTWAFNRAEMETGGTAHAVSFSLPSQIAGSTIFSLLPSNLRNNGSSLPAGTSNYFASLWAPTNRVRVWKFHVDYAVPANSTFTGPTAVTIATFNPGPATAPEQTGNNLDTLAPRAMMQNQYQNVGGTESIWLTHTVGNGAAPNVAQIRWYQLDVTGGTIVTAAPVQQGTWAPDTKYRYMPSLALDKLGDMALGYTVSDSTTFPAIRYAGRLSTDALNTLGQGETSLIDGTGYQCCLFSDGTTNTRWGDYSAMSIDPDGCTFWYTNEYYDTSPATLAQDNWKTRIGAFKFPGCVPNTVGTLQGTVTDAATTNPINGALVSAGIYSLKTNASGFYRFSNLPTGSYTVNVSVAGYANGSANSVVVTSGATTTQNFALNPPIVNTNLAVSAATGTYGGTTTLTATLTQQGGGALSGKTITFTLNGASFANNTAVTNGSGIASLSNVSLVGINAGTYPTGVGASFAAGGGFAGSSGANSLTISKATPVITWNNPANITYGTALSATQLNATTTVPGNFVYTPASGTVLHFGNSQTLSTNFTPTDTTNYNNANKNVSINVQKATLTATAQDKSKTYRATNPSLTYTLTGFVNGDNQAGATSGQPSLTTTATTLSVVNTYPITITVGTLTAADYTFAFVNGTLTVNKATPTINWTNPANIIYGTALSGTQLSATATNPNDSSSVAGNFNYNPASGVVLNAGNAQTLSTTFTPTDTANYNGNSANVSINVSKATPVITWSDPAAITNGTALSATQLNATSPVPGTFGYTPPAGTVLPVGNNQPLMVTLTPTDAVNYNSNSATVHINVLPTPYTLTANPGSVITGAALSISWTAPNGRPATDWIGLYHVGAGNSGPIWWQYTGGATAGTFNLTAPNQVGPYEFRYLLQDGYTDVVTSNTVTVDSGGGGGVLALVASPSTVLPGAPLNISWTAPSGQAASDWIGLYHVGAGNTAVLWWQYTGGATSGSFQLNAPNQVGQYQFRYLLQDGYTDAATSNTVTVDAGGSGGTFELTASPGTVTPGGPLSISWVAPIGRPASDWIGLYPIGAPNNAPIWWQYTGGATTGTVQITAPNQVGLYEFRYLLEGDYTSAATSNTVTVDSGGGGGGVYGLVAAPSNVAAGATLNISWTAPSGRPASDWIGLYQLGAGNTGPIWWHYTGGATSGSFPLSAPNQSGQYEFRYLLHDGYTSVTTSNTVTVP